MYQVVVNDIKVVCAFRVNWIWLIRTGHFDPDQQQIDVIVVNLVLDMFHLFFFLVSCATSVQKLIGGQCIVEMLKVLDQQDDMEDDWQRLLSKLLKDLLMR